MVSGTLSKILIDVKLHTLVFDFAGSEVLHPNAALIDFGLETEVKASQAYDVPFSQFKLCQIRRFLQFMHYPKMRIILDIGLTSCH